MQASRINALVAVLALAMAGAASAQTFDPAQVDAGMAVYKAPGANCEQCHGWTGTGRSPTTSEFSGKLVEGPSLVDTKLDRSALIEVVACGRVPAEGVMPAYRNEAWTPALRCYGKVAADVGPDEKPMQGAKALTPAQVDAVVTYVQAVYQGKGMTLAVCLKYFGDKSKGCDLFR